MKNKIFTLLAAVLLSCPGARANDFQLKHRSSFSGGENDHNPFWPIGWTKSAPAGQGVAPLLKPEDFVVTSILINDPPLALINGKEMAEGEVMAMTVGGQQISVQLSAVQDGQVVLLYRGQSLVVPLRRKGEGAGELR